MLQLGQLKGSCQCLSVHNMIPLFHNEVFLWLKAGRAYWPTGDLRSVLAGHRVLLACFPVSGEKSYTSKNDRYDMYITTSRVHP